MSKVIWKLKAVPNLYVNEKFVELFYHVIIISSTDPDPKPELNPLKMNILFLCMINNILFKFNKSFKKITNVPNFVKLNDILANKNKIIAEGVVKRIFMKMLIR